MAPRAIVFLAPDLCIIQKRAALLTALSFLNRPCYKDGRTNDSQFELRSKSSSPFASLHYNYVTCS